MVLLLLSVPIGITMGVSALFALIADGRIPLIVIIQKLFTGMDSLPLLAVPFFMLAGQLMESGGISNRLVRFAKALVGHLRGGLAMVTVVSSMIFAGISGSSSADTTAIGSLLIPSMIKNGYTRGFAATLQACAGTIGPVIPPSILMIIYGSITGLSIAEMFLAGVIPGVFIGLGLMVASYLYAVKEGYAKFAKASFKEIIRSFIDSIWALIMPLIIIGGILLGVFTATEAGMVAVLYALFVGMVVYKEIKVTDLPKLLVHSAKVSSSLMIIAGMANIFAWVLAREQFPRIAVNFLAGISTNPGIVMLLIIIFFLILGCFVETLAAMIIFVPILQPLVAQFGFDPIHFALVIIGTLLIGQVTPPVGVLLFLTTKMAEAEFRETMRYIPGFVGMMIIVLLIIAFVPDLVMFLPRLVFK
ncbi:MAG: TRAP transporter large permease [bacterium]|nr:TRAP transporter large permease [bacterium]